MKIYKWKSNSIGYFEIFKDSRIRADQSNTTSMTHSEALKVLRIRVENIPKFNFKLH